MITRQESNEFDVLMTEIREVPLTSGGLRQLSQLIARALEILGREVRYGNDQPGGSPMCYYRAHAADEWRSAKFITWGHANVTTAIVEDYQHGNIKVVDPANLRFRAPAGA